MFSKHVGATATVEKAKDYFASLSIPGSPGWYPGNGKSSYGWCGGSHGRFSELASYGTKGYRSCVDVVSDFGSGFGKECLRRTLEVLLFLPRGVHLLWRTTVYKQIHQGNNINHEWPLEGGAGCSWNANSNATHHFSRSRAAVFITSCIAIGGACAFLYRHRVYVWENIYERIHPILHKARSWLIDVGLRNAPNSMHVLRSNFRDTSLPRMYGTTNGHPHPQSATWRSSLSAFGRLLGNKVGINQFILQASTIDVKQGFSYSRTHHWVKDVLVPHCTEEPKEGDLSMIVDVDYYMDMNKFLLANAGPVLLYTFQPTRVAESNGEFSFCFNADNEVEYNVAGGQSYKHKVWDYGSEAITVSSWWKTRGYIVEKRAANEHHAYVLLVPFAEWRGIFAWIARWLRSDTLKHLSIAKDGFAVMDIQGPHGRTRSIGRVNEYNTATLDVKTLEALSGASKLCKHDMGEATVKSWGVEKHSAVVVTDYLRAKLKSPKPPVVYEPTKGIKTYQVLENIKDYEPGHKALMVSFMSPVYPAAYVPDASKNNEQAAINGRIKEPREEAKRLIEQNYHPRVIGYIDEFIKFLVPDVAAGTFMPCDIDEVRERQNRPSQRAMLDQAESVDEPVREVKSFLKAEPYQKTTDPRVITPYNTRDKREYSRFTYPMSDWFGAIHPWYAFGKSPKQIALAVADMAENASAGLHASDMSRMDGHVSNIARDLEAAVLVRFYHKDFHTEVLGLHSAQRNIKGRTKQGVKYPVCDERGSGSPETALFNGVITAFCDYVARRELGCGPKESFEAKKLVAGDDVISTDIPAGIVGSTATLQPDAFAKAAAMIGQCCEVDVFRRGAPYVNFLSRFYTEDVWSGDPTSTCDIPRMLSKLHLTAYTPLSNLAKLQHKLIGLVRTDSYTPIFRYILGCAHRLDMELSIDPDYHISGWWSRWDIDENWPQTNSQLLSGELDESMIEHWFKGKADPEQLYNYLSKIEHIEDLLKMPAITDADDAPGLGHKTKTIVCDEKVVEPDQEKKYEYWSDGSVSKTLADRQKEYPNVPIYPPELKMKMTQEEFIKQMDGPGRMYPDMGKDLCWAFINKKCNRADKCKYLHCMICTTYYKTGKCARDKCKFPHVLDPRLEKSQ